MPRSLSSSARLSVSFCTPALDAVYAPMPAPARPAAAPAPMLTMLPRPRSMQRRQRDLAAHDGRAQVHAVELVPGLDRALEQRLPLEPAGHVHQHVDAAETHRGRGHRPAARFDVAQVHPADQQVPGAEFRPAGRRTAAARGRAARAAPRAPAKARATADPSTPNAPVTTTTCFCISIDPASAYPRTAAITDHRPRPQHSGTFTASPPWLVSL